MEGVYLNFVPERPKAVIQADIGQKTKGRRQKAVSDF
jgi:hypothetical protein